MRKKIWLIFLLLFSFASKAQKSFLGVRAGLNACIQPDDKAIMGRNYLHALNSGFTGAYQISRYFFLKTEINYNIKKKSYAYTTKSNFLNGLIDLAGLSGGVIDTSLLHDIQSFLNDTVYSHYRGSDALHHIEIPLQIGFQWKSFQLSVGPYIGRLVAVKNKEELKQEIPILDMILPLIDTIEVIGPLMAALLTAPYPGYQNAYYIEGSNTDPYQRWDYGVIAELTYHSPERLFFSFRYARSFLNYRIVPVKSQDLHNVFTFSIGYLLSFPLKKSLSTHPQLN